MKKKTKIAHPLCFCVLPASVDKPATSVCVLFSMKRLYRTHSSYILHFFVEFPACEF